MKAARGWGSLLLAATACGGRAEVQSSPEESWKSDANPRLYVANFGSRDISTFEREPNADALVALGSLAVDVSPISLVAAAAQPRLYVGDGFDSKVVTLSVDQTTGALTRLGSVSTADADRVGTTTSALAADPTGRFVYFANCGTDSPGSVGALAVDSVNGLRPSAPPVPTRFCPNGIAVTPSGRIVYVSTQYGYEGDVQGFAVDTFSGALTPLEGSPFAELLAVGIAIAPSGRFLYVSDQKGAVRLFDIEPETGALIDRGVRASTAGNPFSLIVDRAGERLFVGNWSSNSVSAYALDPQTGVPTEVSGSPFGAGASPHVHTVDAAGRFLYVTNQGAGVTALAIGDQGHLTESEGSPFTAGESPAAAVATP